jgi:sulfoxide reductase heme-binding subunit YedZ
MTASQWIRRVVKPGAFVACLVPFALLVRDAFTGGLGANPIEEITHRTGITALTLLLVTLAVTPAKTLLRLNSLVLMRRMLGLFAFFYAVLHFATYLLDQYPYSLGAVAEDVAKRPYITVGFTTLMLLVPLAVTSTTGWVKRLGSRRWQRLHQLVYVAGAGGVLHFLWKVKAEELRPVVYATILVALLSFRLWSARRARVRHAARPAPTRPATVSAAPAPSPLTTE